MSQVYRLVILGVACFVAITCTNASSRLSSSEIKRQADRGPASTKLKPVNIERKGLYIDHNSLMGLSSVDRVAYYGIFVNFTDIQSKFAKRKKSKYSFHEIIREFLVPELEAVNCMSSAWALNNDKGGQSNPTCTTLSSLFRPEESSEWNKFGIIGLSFDHCQRDENKDGVLDRDIMVCPVLGLEKRDGSARVLCSDKRTSSGGHTDSCIAQFNDSSSEKGTKLLVNVLDQCKRNGGGTVEGLSCDSLKQSVERSIAMHQQNCDDGKISADNRLRAFMTDRCSRLYAAVDRVAKAIDHNVNPVNRDTPPADPSCKLLTNEAEQGYNPPTGGKSSEAWNYLMDFSANVCGRTGIKDRRQMASILGDCGLEIGWKLDPQIKDTLVNGARYNNAASLEDGAFVRNFAENFGIAPKFMKELMCGTPDRPTNSAADFYKNVRENLPKLAERSQAAMIGSGVMTWDHLKASGGVTNRLSENEFNILQQWYNRNYTTIGILANSTTTTRDSINGDVEEKHRSFAKKMVETLKNRESVDKAEEQLELAFKELASRRPNKTLSDDQKKLYRAAIRLELIERLQSPLQADRLAKAQSFLNRCAYAATKAGKVNPDDSRDPRQASSNKCYYDEMERDVYDFFKQRVNQPNSADAPPYIIARKDKGFCYSPIKDRDLKRKQIGDTEYISGIFTNPLDKTQEARITLNDDNFSTSQDTGPAKQYVLYVYTCPKDPTLESDVRSVLDEESAI